MGLSPALALELGVRTATRLRIRVRFVGTPPQAALELFDPQPPQAGTLLLTHFAFGSAALTARHRGIIADLARRAVRRMAGLHTAHCVFIEVEGHEDEVGDPARFSRLGAQRAAKVTELLVARMQVEGGKIAAADRREVEITVSSAGPVRPIRSNVTSDGRAMNRRVEIRLRTGICSNVV